MTEQQKAERYDTIVLEADRVQRAKSKLQSANAGINTTSVEYDTELAELNRKLDRLEGEMKKLYDNF